MLKRSLSLCSVQFFALFLLFINFYVPAARAYDLFPVHPDPSYKNRIKSISLPAYTLKEEIKRAFANDKAITSASSLATTANQTSQSGYKPCDDESEIIAGVPVTFETGFEGCPTNASGTLISKFITTATEDFTCGSTKSTKKTLAITKNYKPVLEMIDPNTILDLIHEDPELLDITIDDVYEKLSDQCMSTATIKERWSYQCTISLSDKYNLQPAGAEKQVITYDNEGNPTSMSLSTDQVSWDSTAGAIGQRQYFFTSHKVSVREPNDPYNNEECGSKFKIGYGSSMIHKKYFSTLRTCDKNYPGDNSRCTSSDPTVKAQGNCTVIRPDSQWLFRSGSEGADSYTTKDFNLIVRDTYNSSCSISKRNWFGDNPAVGAGGTINGKPINWSTTDWFHIKSYGSFLWNTAPIDANWNSTAIPSPENLPGIGSTTSNFK